MCVKILKTGYCNLMLAYYVDYLDDNMEKVRTYFDHTHERNAFLKENK